MNKCFVGVVEGDSTAQSFWEGGGLGGGGGGERGGKSSIFKFQIIPSPLIMAFLNSRIFKVTLILLNLFPPLQTPFSNTHAISEGTTCANCTILSASV